MRCSRECRLNWMVCPGSGEQWRRQIGALTDCYRAYLGDDMSAQLPQQVHAHPEWLDHDVAVGIARCMMCAHPLTVNDHLCVAQHLCCADL